MSYATVLFKSLHEALTHSCPQGCARKPREQKEKRILVSPSVVAKGTRSASLRCDWVIILLLILAVCVFTVDSSQSGRERRTIQQDEINPIKASQRSPREQAASRQIRGDATAVERAGQSHMAPGQTGRRAITYCLMSYDLCLSIPPFSPTAQQEETLTRARETPLKKIDALVLNARLHSGALAHLHTRVRTHTPTHLPCASLCCCYA